MNVAQVVYEFSCVLVGKILLLNSWNKCYKHSLVPLNVLSNVGQNSYGPQNFLNILDSCVASFLTTPDVVFADGSSKQKGLQTLKDIDHMHEDGCAK